MTRLFYENFAIVFQAGERLLLSEDCQRVTYMSVVKGKLEVTTSYVYFFDGSPYREDVERHDFRWSLAQVCITHCLDLDLNGQKTRRNF